MAVTSSNLYKVVEHRLRLMAEEARPRASAIWLSAKRYIAWSFQWSAARQKAVFLLAGIALAIVLFFVNVIAAAAILAAWVALIRHYAQTEADRQRRITESFSKAVEQLADDRIEVRLGGIYTLERISRESLDDHWTVMETLCAFVRERGQSKQPEEELSETMVSFYRKSAEMERRISPSTDIAAVMTVIARRDKDRQRLERDKEWRLNFRGANLKWVDLSDANLSYSDFSGCDLSNANLFRAHLNNCYLMYADLQDADLIQACLIDANLSKANLTDAKLIGADLRGASLFDTDVSGANFMHTGLTQSHLDYSCGRLEAFPKGPNLTLDKPCPPETRRATTRRFGR